MLLERFIRNIRSAGQQHFTLDDFRQESGLPKEYAYNHISRFKKLGYIASPIKGLYVIVPAEYSNIGCLPPHLLIPIIMDYLKLDYYACLLTAASFHGASHQKPQIFQVMVNKRMRNIKCGNIRIEFLQNKNLLSSIIEKKVVSTGYLAISSPEQTAYDIMKHIGNSGGINNVATILYELIDKMSGNKLVDLAKKVGQHTWLQRIGYIIDELDPINEAKQRKILKALHNYIISLKTKITYAALHPGITRVGSHDEKWKIIKNTTVESDL